MNQLCVVTESDNHYLIVLVLCQMQALKWIYIIIETVTTMHYVQGTVIPTAGFGMQMVLKSQTLSIVRHRIRAIHS
jgi:hypothetical protein